MESHVKNMKKSIIDKDEILTNHISDKDLISRIKNKLPNLNSKNIKNLIRKWTKDTNRHFTKENIQMGSKHMKDVQLHYSLGKCKLKPHETSLHTYQNG